MRIIFTGGGTLGSVTPLIALYQELGSNAHAMWIGTRFGIEREYIHRSHMSFRGIFSGKLRRYWSIKNVLDPFLLCIGIVQSIRIISAFQPDIIIGAGGYVSAPVLWAAWFLKKKALILQLDLQPSLTNLITHFCAQKIALACEEQKKYFPQEKSVVTGIPVRKKVYDLARLMHDEKQKISLRVACGIPDDTMPIITVVGGGTGANFLNRLIYETIGDLTRMCHVVHITGKGKSGTPREPYIHGKYHAYEYLGEELLEYIALADCVITRAGMGMLSELSVFGTPTIIIPIPYSHQEKNAVYFEREKHAALYLSQQGLTKEKYISSIRRVLHDNVLRQELSYNMYHALPREGAQNIKKLIEEVIKP